MLNRLYDSFLTNIIPLVLFPLLLSSVSLPIQSQPTEIKDLEEKVDLIFSDWNQTNSPGCAIGVIKEGEFLLAKGYGMANLEYDIPNNRQTVFRIGSTSKQFTAACIILLAQKGKLKLSDNLRSFFPDFPSYADQITVQHLLNHTSGIRDYLTIAYLAGLRDDDYYTDEDIMQWLTRQKELNFQPGEAYTYSNSGYWLLGQIVNYVSGMNMAEFAHKEIFEPLSMSNTHFHHNHKEIVKHRASGYQPTENGYEISMTTLDMIGDGGIFTSIKDIKKWDDAFYQSNIFNKEFWDMMTQQGKLANGKELSYASGLIINEYKGFQTIRHGGAFVGFRAELLRFPKEKLTIAIFANRSDADPSQKANEVADLFLPLSSSTQVTVPQENPISGTIDSTYSIEPKILALYEGQYIIEEELITARVFIQNDTLIFYQSEENQGPLLPIAPNTFTIPDPNTKAIAEFQQLPDDTYLMKITINDRIHYTFQPYEPYTYTLEKLQNIPGIYYSNELNVNYEIRLENKKLILYIDGKKYSPIKPIQKNTFSSEIGKLIFDDTDNASTLAFRLEAGRVKNVLFQKK